MMHVCVMSSHNEAHKKLYGGLNTRRYTLYRLFHFFKLFPNVGKGLIGCFLTAWDDEAIGEGHQPSTFVALSVVQTAN